MYNFKIHPLFYLLAAFLIIQGQALAFVNTTLVVLLHEMAHARIAYGRGYIMNRIVLMPYGAVLYGEERMRRDDAVVIALAGPLFNLFIAVLFFALWWLIPAAYPFTDSFVYANVSVALFNMLPIFPLDGSRIVLAVSKDKLRTLKRLKTAGIIFAFAIFAFFIFSAFQKINVTAGIMAVFIYAGAVSGTKKETYVHLGERAFAAKSLSTGVEKREIYISCDAKLVKLLKLIKPDSSTVFHIVDGKMRVLKSVDEAQAEEIILKHDSDKKLIDVL